MAKLDIASDSDSEGRGFESLQAGHFCMRGGAFMTPLVILGRIVVSSLLALDALSGAGKFLGDSAKLAESIATRSFVDRKTEKSRDKGEKDSKSDEQNKTQATLNKLESDSTRGLSNTAETENVKGDHLEEKKSEGVLKKTANTLKTAQNKYDRYVTGSLKIPLLTKNMLANLAKTCASAFGSYYIIRGVDQKKKPETAFLDVMSGKPVSQLLDKNPTPTPSGPV